MPMNVAPSGLPRLRRRRRVWACWASTVDVDDEKDVLLSSGRSDELSRNSWVTAMPMEAKERDVRSQARKVRSMSSISECPAYRLEDTMRHGGASMAAKKGTGRVYSPNARWSLATLPLFSNSTLPHFSQNCVHHPAAPFEDAVLLARFCGAPRSNVPAVPSCGAAPLA